TGNNVAKIQVWLNYLSNVYSPLFSLKIDGIFGTTTKNDVVMFQKMFSLKPDGIVGEKTWKLLSCVYNNILGGKSYPIKPTYIGYGLAVGAVDDYVKILQYMLVTASFKYPQIEAGGKIKVDGIFGEITKKAVNKNRWY
ncbi:MAG: peptidoglycan-binding domain-containing protein, partial [Clostridia bacterium]